jgi:hypothetical protein
MQSEELAFLGDGRREIAALSTYGSPNNSSRASGFRCSTSFADQRS